MAKVAKPTPPPFVGKLFNCEKYGHHQGADCPNKKTTLLAVTCQRMMKLKTSLQDLLFQTLPELHVYPGFDYGEDSYYFHSRPQIKW